MMKILRTLTLLALAFLSAPAVAQDAELFRDMNAPMDARIHDLLDRLTVDEKIQLMVNDASAIDRPNASGFLTLEETTTSASERHSATFC